MLYSVFLNLSGAWSRNASVFAWVPIIRETDNRSKSVNLYIHDRIAYAHVLQLKSSHRLEGLIDNPFRSVDNDCFSICVCCCARLQKTRTRIEKCRRSH